MAVSIPTLTLTFGENPSCFLLSGDLTLFPISASIKSIIGFFPSAGDWLIDCEKVTRVDTAGLAFLISCIRQAQQFDIQLKILHLSPATESLMVAHGVSSLFESVWVH